MRIRFFAVFGAAALAVIGSQGCSTSSGSSSTSGATLTCAPVGQKDGNCPKDTPNTQADYNACRQCLALHQAVLDCLVKQGYVFALGCDADGYTNAVNKPTDAQTKACATQGNAADACENALLNDGGTDSGSGMDSGSGDDGGDAATD